MPYLLPNLTTIQNQTLADIQSGLPTQLLTVSVLRVLAQAVANQSYQQLQYLDWILQQCTPFTATAEYLEAWAGLKGITRKTPLPAGGYIVFQGATGTQIATGAQLTSGSGVAYNITAGGTVGSTLPFAATSPGSAGNTVTSTMLTLTTPVAGLVSPTAATVGSTGTLAPIVGGEDQETDSQLRTRMLAAYAAPPQGGSVTDYQNWALAVPEVTRAWCDPVGGGAGTVVIYTMMDDSSHTNGFLNGSNGGATSESRIQAATGDQLTVANYIYPLRTATTLVYSASPTAAPQAVTTSGITNNATNVAAITLALNQLFVAQGNALGTTIYTSQITQAIAQAVGNSNFNLVTPTATIALPVGELPTLGALVVG